MFKSVISYFKIEIIIIFDQYFYYTLFECMNHNNEQFVLL